MRPRHRCTSKTRHGFTLVELAMVVAIMGIVTALSIPRVSAMRSSAAIRAAKQDVVTSLARARALAVQQGRTVRLVRSASSIRIAALSGGVDQELMRPRDLQDMHLVTLDGAAEIGFDARGFGNGIAGMAVIRIRRGELMDSVCVVRTGKILSMGFLP